MAPFAEALLLHLIFALVNWVSSLKYIGVQIYLYYQAHYVKIYIMSIVAAERVDPNPSGNGDDRELSPQNRTIPVSDALRALYNTQTFIVSYLGEAATSSNYASGRGSIISFSKSIPRRPDRSAGKGFDGDYIELAHQTLVAAQTAEAFADQSGVIHLLGSGIESRYLSPRYDEATMVTEDSLDAATDYQDGVATLIWKAGFVRYPRGEDTVPYGGGEINPQAEVESVPVDYGQYTMLVRVPFEPANPLHRLLVLATANENNRWQIELSMPTPITYGGPNHVSPYLNIQFVESPYPQQLTT